MVGPAFARHARTDSPLEAGRGDDFLLARFAGRAVMATAWASPAALAMGMLGSLRVRSNGSYRASEPFDNCDNPAIVGPFQPFSRDHQEGQRPLCSVCGARSARMRARTGW